MSIEEDIANFLTSGGALTKIEEAKVSPGKKASDGSIEESAERNAEYEVGDDV